MDHVFDERRISKRVNVENVIEKSAAINILKYILHNYSFRVRYKNCIMLYIDRI